METEKAKTRSFHFFMGVLIMLFCAFGAAQSEAAEVLPKSVNTYSITRVEGQFDWDDIPVLTLDNILWLPDYGIRASGQFCYDEQALYVHLQAVEKDIRAEYTQPLSPVCQDSCLEFFLMPDGEDRYMNFEINPNGCLYMGFGYDRNSRITVYREDAEDLFQIRTEQTADGWSLTYQIPLSFLRIFYPGYDFSGILRANVYKCGDLTLHKHYLSWNPVASEKPDFHRPEDFGVMVFA